MISAIVLAAGQSTRMGQPKMYLPWGETTVIGKVVSTLIEGGISNIIVIAGSNLNELKFALLDFNVTYSINEHHAFGEMLSSVKVGLSSLEVDSNAALIVLGDQPQIEVGVVREIIVRYETTKAKIIVPSYKMHRGHPWLIDRYFWGEIIELAPSYSLREFLNKHQDTITYVNVDTSSILEDLDTPQDYLRYRP